MAVRDDGKLSLTLFARLDDCETPDRAATLAMLALNAALNAENVRHVNSIAKAIETSTAAVNDLGKRFGNNTAESRAGYVAEAVHTADQLN